MILRRPLTVVVEAVVSTSQHLLVLVVQVLAGQREAAEAAETAMGAARTGTKASHAAIYPLVNSNNNSNSSNSSSSSIHQLLVTITRLTTPPRSLPSLRLTRRGALLPSDLCTAL
jgi:hypothetical protein